MLDLRPANLCAAICLALALLACAQPPAPQPTPLPTNAATPTPASAIQPAPPTTPPTSPPANVAFTQITAGKGHACGIRENATALCWGHDRNGYGSLAPPAQTAFRQISAGLNFTCGLRQDQTIACWGNNSAGQAAPPLGSFSEIAAGANHACALPLPQDSPPALLCWGRQFPNGAETLPLNVPVSDIQAGGDSTCGLTPQGDMACLRINQRLSEITPGPFTQLAAGLAHTCALREDGSAFCQGNPDRLRATPPPTKFAQIAAGWYHTCGITRARRIECWGSGVPAAPGERLAAPDGEFVAITIGWRNSCALSPDRRAVCWSTPDYGASSFLNIAIPKAFGGAKFDAPVDIFPWPSGGLAIVDRSGLIAAYRDRPNAPPPLPILDLTDEVVCCPDESGMLSAALDPQFDDFPFLYLWYSAAQDDATGEGEPGYVGRLTRFRVNNGVALKDSALVILEAYLPEHKRRGGDIRFGADGMLYLGIGDNTTTRAAQTLDTLRGKIIRIDVRGATAAQPYRIPPDNPFVSAPNARPEIWAYGMRNPWRMDFDPSNPNRLFVADVGEHAKDEVSIATAGANLGWPLCEADLCQESLDAATAANLAPPAIAYGVNDRGCAIIGGHVVPWLDNAFIFGDLCSRRLWLLEPNNSPGSPQSWRMRELANLSESTHSITAFGAAPDGSVYILPRTGPILRLRPDTVK